MKPSTSVFIDKYHPKSDGTCSISIRVTYNRKKKYYATPFSLTLADFEKSLGVKPRGEFKTLAIKLLAYEKKATDIIDSLPVFTWQLFEKYYLANRAAKDSISYVFDEYAKTLREEGRIGTAVSYECAKKSLEAFRPDSKFIDITPEFLSKYERWMLSKGNSVTTIGIYLRSLRTLFNTAIGDGMLSKEVYPFGKKKYEIPTGSNVKKALTLSDIALIYNYQPTVHRSIANMAKDIWVFMYLCNGINVKDLCLLKYQNIRGGMIEFERAKTIRTKRNVEAIRVPLSNDLLEIIEKWGNKPKDLDNFIFPILSNGQTPERQRQLIQQFTKQVNKYMRKLAKALNITSDLTTYVARHSFATILLRSGVSTEFISEALGHTSINTTKNYLAGFEDEAKSKNLNALLAFKN